MATAVVFIVGAEIKRKYAIAPHLPVFFCEKLDSVASIKAVDLLAIVRFLVLRHGGAIQIVS